jgi:predicted outer membrane protein
MFKRRVLGVAAAALVAIWGDIALANPLRGPKRPQESDEAVPSPRRPALSPLSDPGIAARLHRIDRAHIQAAKVAERRAQLEAVRAFAASVARAHERTDELLMDWAAAQEEVLEALKERVAEEERPGDDWEVPLVEALEAMPIERFDREFLSLMVRSYDQAIDFVSRSRDQVASFDLRALLQDVLPTLHQQRTTARKLLRELEDAPARTPGSREGQGAPAPAVIPRP